MANLPIIALNMKCEDILALTRIKYTVINMKVHVHTKNVVISKILM